MNDFTGEINALPKMSGYFATPEPLTGGIGAKTITLGGSSGECDVFVGTAGVTTFDEFMSAHQQGKACILRKPYVDNYVPNITYLLWEAIYAEDVPTRLRFLCVTPYGVEEAYMYSSNQTEVYYTRVHLFLDKDDLPEVPEPHSKVMLIVVPLEDGSDKYALVRDDGSQVVTFDELSELLESESIEVLDQTLLKAFRFNGVTVVNDEQGFCNFSNIDIANTDNGRKIQVSTLAMGTDSLCTLTVETFDDFTEIDKEKLVQEVIAALPVYNGEVEEA